MHARTAGELEGLPQKVSSAALRTVRLANRLFHEPPRSTYTNDPEPVEASLVKRPTLTLSGHRAARIGVAGLLLITVCVRARKRMPQIAQSGVGDGILDPVVLFLVQTGRGLCCSNGGP